jgi:hypothetical protein
VDLDIAQAQLRNETGHQFNDTIEGNIASINNTLDSLSIRNQQKRKIEILFLSGSVFVLNAGLNTEKPRPQRPLTVIPTQLKNNVNDSCSPPTRYC